MFRILDACLGSRVHLMSLSVHQAARLSVHTMLIYSFAETLAELHVYTIPIVERRLLFMAGNRQTRADHICDLHCPIKGC